MHRMHGLILSNNQRFKADISRHSPDSRQFQYHSALGLAFSAILNLVAGFRRASGSAEEERHKIATGA